MEQLTVGQLVAELQKHPADLPAFAMVESSPDWPIVRVTGYENGVTLELDKDPVCQKCGCSISMFGCVTSCGHPDNCLEEGKENDTDESAIRKSIEFAEEVVLFLKAKLNAALKNNEVGEGEWGYSQADEMCLQALEKLEESLDVREN